MLNRRLVIAAAAMASLALAGCHKGGPQGSAQGDQSLGNPNAKIQVTEYASASCIHCARFDQEVFPTFKAKYIDTGKVHYTLREFLTPPESVSAAGFLLARCVGPGKYFPTLEEIWKNLVPMFQTNDYRGTLLRIAESEGMTEEQFNKCVSDPDALKALNARVERAITQDKISATPTFLVNGKKAAEGEATLAQLDAAIAAASK